MQHDTKIDLDAAIWERVQALPQAIRRPLELIAVAARPIRLTLSCTRLWATPNSQ